MHAWLAVIAVANSVLSLADYPLRQAWLLPGADRLHLRATEPAASTHCHHLGLGRRDHVALIFERPRHPLDALHVARLLAG